MDDLKRCPFCGGEAEIKRYPEWSWAQYQPMCTICLATFDEAFYTAEKAIEAWNRRANHGKGV